MKKNLVIIFIFLFQIAKAQNYGDDKSYIVSDPISIKRNTSPIEKVRATVIKGVLRSLQSDSLFSAPKGYAHFVSVFVVVNNEGNIDTTILTSKPKSPNFKIVGNLASNFKTTKLGKAYANVIFLIPILFIRQEDKSTLRTGDFPLSFGEMFPEQYIGIKKSFILLKPEINYFNYGSEN